MYFSLSSSQMFDVNYATQQIISKAHNILKLDNSEIDPAQSDTFFVEYNTLNYYSQVLINQFAQVADLAVSNFQDLDDSSKNFLIISICAMLFFSVVLTFLLGRTIFAKQVILSIFLDIPEKTAKYLYSKCENFLAQLGSGEEDDVHSEIELYIDDKEANDEARTSVFGRKRKKFKNADRGGWSFLIKMFFIAIFIECYFVINYVLGDQAISNMKDLLPEYNFTVYGEAFYSYSLNCELQTIFDPTWQVADSISTKIVPTLIEMMYEVDSKIHEVTNHHFNF